MSICVVIVKNYHPEPSQGTRTFTAGRSPYASSEYLTGNFHKCGHDALSILRFTPIDSVTSDT
ncbi:2486_t:CDS:2 [Funneliformis geosporum]|nr:2486_t:CDS:2 [Funneliformis geosporum]